MSNATVSLTNVLTKQSRLMMKYQQFNTVLSFYKSWYRAGIQAIIQTNDTTLFEIKYFNIVIIVTQRQIYIELRQEDSREKNWKVLSLYPIFYSPWKLGFSTNQHGLNISANGDEIWPKETNNLGFGLAIRKA